MAKPAAPPEDFELWAQIGERIENLRAEKGLTHLQLARAVSLSRSYVTRVINGKRRANVNQLERFANALGVDVSALLPGDGTRFHESTRVTSSGDTAPGRESSTEGGYTVHTDDGRYIGRKLDEIADDDLRGEAAAAAHAAIRKVLRPSKLDASRGPSRVQHK